MSRLAQLRGLIQALFPERHLYLRSGGEMKGVVLSPARQMIFAAIALGLLVWFATSSIAILVGAFTQSRSDEELAQMQARSERWVADREARLNSAVAQLNASGASLGGLAESIEKRHAALALLLTDLRGEPGAMAALAPALKGAPDPEADPIERIAAVQANQERLVGAAEDYARTRADRLRLAFRLAGLAPSGYASATASGGPLLEARDPRALAAVLDVDERFAGRIQKAAENLSAANALSETARTAPARRAALACASIPSRAAPPSIPGSTSCRASAPRSCPPPRASCPTPGSGQAMARPSRSITAGASRPATPTSRPSP
jgi:hypothetical protein